MDFGENTEKSTNDLLEQQSLPEEPGFGTLNNPSASGANPELPGFSSKNLDDHWVGGKSDHSNDYQGFTKEQYAQRAHDLVRSSVGGDIDGYKASGGSVVRYDTVSNDFVKGMPGGIKSMFKPKRGVEYFNDQLTRDGGVQND